MSLMNFGLPSVAPSAVSHADMARSTASLAKDTSRSAASIARLSTRSTESMVTESMHGSRSMSRASVFNSEYIAKEIIDDRIAVENSLLKDLLFVFQGIDGTHIRYDLATDSFVIQKVKLSPPLREIANKLCELGWLYRKIQLRLNALATHANLGLIEQSLLSAIKDEMHDYYRLIAILEGHIEYVEKEESQRLTLKRLYVWTTSPLQRLRIMSVLLEVCESILD